ncbi:hypothetical protein CBL_09548 [Carabus blaptoides fortunei]
MPDVGVLYVPGALLVVDGVTKMRLITVSKAAGVTNEEEHTSTFKLKGNILYEWFARIYRLLRRDGNQWQQSRNDNVTVERVVNEEEPSLRLSQAETRQLISISPATRSKHGNRSKFSRKL